ncbi:MAG TPA: NHL repeat-containing protein [Acidobacteriota bacterium]|nr:NHL repeat-containing protein [Acidobacteriota bacterium]
MTAVPELVVTGFGKDAPFNVPQAIVLDAARGEILVGNTGNHTIEAFSLGGRPLARYIHRVERGDGAWVDGSPIALAVDSAGRVLVADASAAYVDILDARGRSVGRLEPPIAAGSASGPSAIAVLRSGAILVGMSGETGRIHRFTREYALDGSWGEPGRSPGMLANIRGLVELADGSIAVVCLDTKFAVQRFSPEGAFRNGFGVHEIGPGNISFPSGVTALANGTVLVSDELRQLIHVFDMEGSVLASLGGGGMRPGEFQYPSALSSDGRSRLAVVERLGARLQLLQLAGTDPE